MTDPVFVNQKTVDQIHNEQDHKALPKPCEETSRAVDHVHTDQHIDQISRKTQASEKHTPLPDLLRGRQTKLDDALLYLLVVQMDHADGTITDADRTDQIQQKAQSESFCDQFDCQHIRPSDIALSNLSSNAGT